MWNDSLISAALAPGRSLTPLAWVPDDRYEAFGPIDVSQVQPASLDVRLAGQFIRHPDGQFFETDARYPYHLEPGGCVLGCLVERFALPEDVVARVEGKSSWARHFLTVHSAGFIDPGFRGDVTLELKNDGHATLELTPGALIAQVSFQWLVAPARRPYGTEGLGSHYQNQEGATPSWG